MTTLQNPLQIAFDLDGVILDSELTIKQCYRSAGCMPPDNLFEMEGIPWLEEQVGVENAAHVKRTKDVFYAKAIFDMSVPANDDVWNAILHLRRFHPVHLLTGASFLSIDALRSVTREWPFVFAVGKMTQARKLVTLGLLHGRVIYIDDQPVPEGLHVPGNVKVIQYTRGMDILEEICSV